MRGCAIQRGEQFQSGNDIFFAAGKWQVTKQIPSQIGDSCADGYVQADRAVITSSSVDRDNTRRVISVHTDDRCPCHTSSIQGKITNVHACHRFVKRYNKVNIDSSSRVRSGAGDGGNGRCGFVNRIGLTGCKSVIKRIGVCIYDGITIQYIQTDISIS